MFLLSSIANSVNKAVNICTQCPYPEVHHADVGILTVTEKIQILKKYFHKYLILLFSGQLGLCKRSIPANARVLFIYHGVTNLGDSLMDFSGRRLLKNSRRFQLDLLIDASLADLYQEDDVFGRIYTNPEDAKKYTYDFIVLNNLNIRTVKAKAKYFKKVPFSSTQGFYFGYDYNHIELSYSAFNSMYRLGFGSDELRNTARPYLNDMDARYVVSEKEFNFDKPVVAIAVGGREEYRIYRRWHEVLTLISNDRSCSDAFDVVLLGSDNGLDDARLLTELQFPGLQVVSIVNKINLIQCRALLSKVKVFLAPDGGLMHLAHTVDVPTISLFSSDVGPEMRLTKACKSTPIQSQSNVNDIDPQQILEELKKII